MDMPKDPAILLSYVNTKLRDEFPSLSDFCKSLGVDESTLKEDLRKIQYEYDEKMNKFI